MLNGTVTLVLSVQVVTISTQKESAVKLNLNAKSSIKMLESANHAIKVTPSIMEHALSLLLIWDVKLGMETINAFNVQLDITLMLMVNAYQFLTSAELGMRPPEHALLATQDTLLIRDNALETPILLFPQPTHSATPLMELSVWLVLIELSSILMEFALLLVTTVILGML